MRESFLISPPASSPSPTARCNLSRSGATAGVWKRGCLGLGKKKRAVTWTGASIGGLFPAACWAAIRTASLQAGRSLDDSIMRPLPT